MMRKALLLVLGLSVLFGGVKYKEQYFNRAGARTSAVSLSLAAIGNRRLRTSACLISARSASSVVKLSPLVVVTSDRRPPQ